MGPKAYAETGGAVLSAAASVDTRLVARRLAAFARAQRAYTAAQRTVQAAEEQVRAARIRLAAANSVHREAVERFASALVNDGASRQHPFEDLRGDAPSAIDRFGAGRKIAAVRALAAAAERSEPLSGGTRRAVAAARSAGCRVEAAYGALQACENLLRHRRDRRDALGAQWKVALAALKHGARAAAFDGAPHLYAALFGHVQARTTKRRKRPPRRREAPVSV